MQVQTLPVALDNLYNRKENMDSCCVVDQFCEAPANVTPKKYAHGICFACGQSVCSKCSSLRKYYNYGKVRLCNNCQIEYDGNDKIVMNRLYKLAQ